MTVTRVQDTGRHKLVSAQFSNIPVQIVTHASTPIGPDMNRIALDPAKISVFRDDWRIEPRRAPTTNGGNP